MTTIAGQTAPQSRTGERRNPVSQEQIVLGVTVLLFLGLSIFLPGFLSTGNILTLLRNVSLLGILAVGMAVVVIGRGIDLSQVAIFGIGAAWAVQLLGSGHSLVFSIGAGLAGSLLVGVINGFAIAFVEMPALFATLASGILTFGAGRAFLLHQRFVYVPAEREGFLRIGQGATAGIPNPILVFAVVALLAHAFLKYTTVGRFIYAHGDNDEAARLTGIAVRPLTILEYAVSAVIGCVAGVLMASSLAALDTQIINSTLIFDVILVVVLGGVSLLGGRGSIYSVVVGTCLMGTLLNGMILLDLNNNVQNIVKSVVLLGAIVLDNRLHPRDEETARQGDI